MNMSWRNIVTEWMSSKNEFMDLVGRLICTNIIPATLVDDQNLHSILLNQITLETLGDINVPRAPQGNNFTYRANAKETILLIVPTQRKQPCGILIRRMES